MFRWVVAYDGGVSSRNATTLARFERALAEVAHLLGDRATAEDLVARCGHDLPPASWALLEYLDGHGPMPVSDVAACHGVDVSSVTPRLKALEAGGFIARHRLAEDARVHVISITDAGLAALARLHEARRSFLAGAIADVAQADLAVATGVLELIATRLSTAEERVRHRTARRAAPS